jgi:hypothetical protein
LRERGQHDEAEQLRAGALPALIAALRRPEDSDSSVAERLDGIFALEAERVANATVLAELLLPMISEQLRTAPLSQAQSPLPSAAALPESARLVKPAPSPRVAASIADFIDEMIAQESPPDRSGGTTQRRAS